MKCPFCKAEVGGMFRHLKKIMDKETDKSAHKGTLCSECGEPIFMTTTGFRKPTAVEYADIATQPAWQTARLAWLEVEQRQRRGIIHGNWMGFRDQALEPLIAGLMDKSASMKDFMRVIEMIFYCGSVSTLGTVLEDVDRCDGRMHLDAILAVHRAELDALFSRLGYDVANMKQRSSK